MISNITALATCLSLLTCGICSANQGPPKHIRVSFQYIEVTHPVLTEMLAAKDHGGPALHAKAIALAKQGKAKILETCMVVTRAGHKATVESIRELIFPTEYQPPELQNSVPLTPEQRAAMAPHPPVNPVFRSITAFETRNTGVTFEVKPTLGANDQIIDLRFVPEIVNLIRVDTWMEHTDPWGDASLRMPVLETWRVNTSVTLLDGQFELVSVITPKPAAPAPAAARKILVFVRADVLTLPP